MSAGISLRIQTPPRTILAEVVLLRDKNLLPMDGTRQELELVGPNRLQHRVGIFLQPRILIASLPPQIRDGVPQILGVNRRRHRQEVVPQPKVALQDGDGVGF